MPPFISVLEDSYHCKEFVRVIHSVLQRTKKCLPYLKLFDFRTILNLLKEVNFLLTSCLHFLQPLASAYGLAKHRDGRWEWAIAPGVSPSSRYQHAAVCSVIFNFPSFSLSLDLHF